MRVWRHKIEKWPYGGTSFENAVWGDFATISMIMRLISHVLARWNGSNGVFAVTAAVGPRDTVTAATGSHCYGQRCMYVFQPNPIEQKAAHAYFFDMDGLFICSRGETWQIRISVSSWLCCLYTDKLQQNSLKYWTRTNTIGTVWFVSSCLQ